MYCPQCGNNMTMVGKDVDHIDCEWEGAEDIYDESIHWSCQSGCFSKDNPLIQHAAPIYNIKDTLQCQFAEVGGSSIVGGILWTRPSTSWSLTKE